MRRWWGLPRGDDGAFPLEAAILTPVVILFLCLVIAFGRTTLAGNAVDSAAKEAAREASITRDPRDATALKASALKAATKSLDQDGLSCRPLDVAATYHALKIDALGNVDLGKVEVTVSCVVSLSGVAFPGTPGSKTMTGRFSSVVDRYRERG
ncbi:pilus assembly protein [Streptomyces sp. SID3343]|nr:pilus assembly protein [Streptomyces sp. SID3343]